MSTADGFGLRSPCNIQIKDDHLIVNISVPGPSCFGTDPDIHTSFAYPDPHRFEKLDPDPHQSEKPNPDPQKVKSMIRIRIRIKVKIQELWSLKMDLWRAVDAHKGGGEAQNGAVEGL